MRKRYQLQIEQTGIRFHLTKKILCRFLPNYINHPLLRFVSQASHLEPGIEFDSQRAPCNDSCLVQDSTVDSLFEREASLTSHKAAKTTTRFTTSGDTDLCKSAPRNRMLGNRISSDMLEADGKKGCVDGDVDVRGDGDDVVGEEAGMRRDGDNAMGQETEVTPNRDDKM